MRINQTVPCDIIRWNIINENDNKEWNAQDTIQMRINQTVLCDIVRCNTLNANRLFRHPLFPRVAGVFDSDPVLPSPVFVYQCPPLIRKMLRGVHQTYSRQIILWQFCRQRVDLSWIWAPKRSRAYPKHVLVADSLGSTAVGLDTGRGVFPYLCRCLGGCSRCWGSALVGTHIPNSRAPTFQRVSSCVNSHMCIEDRSSCIGCRDSETTTKYRSRLSARRASCKSDIPQVL